MKDRVIAVIPARGGSSRIPQKNIVDLNGNPLIEWTIYDALDSKYINDVYVSTDDKQIAEVSKKCGAQVITRPDNISSATSQSEEAIVHALEKIDYDADYVFMMQCTCPFRKVNDIDSAIQKIIATASDSLFMATINNRWIWTENNKPKNYDFNKRPRTQDKEVELIEGSDYLFSVDMFLKRKCRFGGKITHFVCDELSGIDIDNMLDLRIARAIAKEFGFYAKNK